MSLLYSTYLDYLSLPEEEKVKFLNMMQSHKGGKAKRNKKVKTRKLRRKN
jgi:hypothetical protein